jgi:hypothetical protein
MSAKSGFSGFSASPSVPTLIVVGILIIVLGAIGFFEWKMFAPPPDPAAGMTTDQKNAEIQRRVQQTGQKVLMDRMMGNPKPGLSGVPK